MGVDRLDESIDHSQKNKKNRDRNIRVNIINKTLHYVNYKLI